MFNNFDVWKLNTLQDYLNFILVAAFFTAVVLFFIRRINNARNDESAALRVGKRLKLKQGKVYSNVTFDFGGVQQHYDHLIVDAAGIVAVKCIGRGLKIYGSPEDAMWKVTDNKLPDKRINNPVKELSVGFEAMRKHLSNEGLYRANIDPLVVFADPFAQPELYLGRDSCCIIFDDLKKWVQNRILRAQGRPDKLDFDAAIKALDKAVK